MSDRDEEKGQGFKVTDKRRFAIDEEGRVIAAEPDADEKPADAAPPATEPPAPEPDAPPQEAAEAGAKAKRSLRERIMDRLSGKEKDGEAAADADDASGPLPAIDFAGFILSFSTSALVHFGEIEDPMTGQKRQNLAAAKQTIDILGMLGEKTRGNLTPEEERLLQAILYDLRLRFVTLSKKAAS